MKKKSAFNETVYPDISCVHVLHIVAENMQNKTAYKENQLAIQEVSLALRESTKNLCKNLKENPNISGNLFKIQQERTGRRGLIFTSRKSS